MIIKHMNCVHDLHLKPYLTVSIQDTASQLLMNSQYNSIQLSNSEKYGLPSSFLTKQEE